MAICLACKHEMTDRDTLGCVELRQVEYEDGLLLDAIPFEANSIKEETAFYWSALEKYLNYEDWYTSRIKSWLYLRCSGCFACDSGIHHPGCDQERCPKCEGQLISCRCNEGDDSMNRVDELVESLLSLDSDRECPFCEKNDWNKDGGVDLHEVGCPFEIAADLRRCNRSDK